MPISRVTGRQTQVSFVVRRPKTVALDLNFNVVIGSCTNNAMTLIYVQIELKGSIANVHDHFQD